jgi:hypothetical protein
VLDSKTGAEVMMPRHAYSRARLRARFHVQVEYERPAIKSPPKLTRVRGYVRRIFRGDDSLKATDVLRMLVRGHVRRLLRAGSVLQQNDVIQFHVAVCNSGDHFPPGGDIWRRAGDLKAGRVMEVFLNGTPPHCYVAASQWELVHGVLDSPMMQVPTEEEVAAEWASFTSGPLGDDECECPSCGQRYKPTDYQASTLEWYCSSCKSLLPRPVA